MTNMSYNSLNDRFVISIILYLIKKINIFLKVVIIIKGCYTIYDEFYTPDGEVLEICVVKGGFAVRTNNRFCFFNPSLKGCKDFVYTYIITSAQNIL